MHSEWHRFCYFRIFSNLINTEKIVAHSCHATLKVDLQILSTQTILQSTINWILNPSFFKKTCCCFLEYLIYITSYHGWSLSTCRSTFDMAFQGCATIFSAFIRQDNKIALPYPVPKHFWCLSPLPSWILRVGLLKVVTGYNAVRWSLRWVKRQWRSQTARLRSDLDDEKQEGRKPSVYWGNQLGFSTSWLC